MILKKLNKITKKIKKGFSIGATGYTKGIPAAVKKAKLKVEGSGDTEGARKAKEMARKRINSGKTIAEVQAANKKSMQKAAAKKHKAFKNNRAKMDAMRKNNPEKYKRLKKKQRKEANIKSMKAGSHTWD